MITFVQWFNEIKMSSGDWDFWVVIFFVFWALKK